MQSYDSESVSLKLYPMQCAKHIVLFLRTQHTHYTYNDCMQKRIIHVYTTTHYTRVRNNATYSCTQQRIIHVYATTQHTRVRNIHVYATTQHTRVRNIHVFATTQHTRVTRTHFIHLYANSRKKDSRK